MKTTSERYSGIDFTKFICSLLVVMIHIAPFGLQSAESPIRWMNFALQQYICRLAVPFFFVCNGYFLFKKTDIHNIDFSFLKRTIFKVLRLYIIWSIIYFPISLRVVKSYSSGVKDAILIYLKYFFFIGSYDHLWYLNALIVVLIIITVCLKIGMKPTHIFALSAVFYLVGIFGDSYFGLIRSSHGFILSIYESYNNFFTTTRNGLFFGMFFVSVGMILANKNIQKDRGKNLSMFFVFLVLLGIEVYLVNRFSLSRDRNMYILLAPTVYYLFRFALFSNVFDKYSYILGAISKIVFYSHIIFEVIVRNTLKLLNYDLTETPFHFMTVVFITILFSLIVVEISAKEKFKWLKYFY